MPAYLLKFNNSWSGFTSSHSDKYLWVYFNLGSVTKLSRNIKFCKDELINQIKLAFNFLHELIDIVSASSNINLENMTGFIVSYSSMCLQKSL